jgi:hypothetical protein
MCELNGRNGKKLRLLHKFDDKFFVKCERLCSFQLEKLKRQLDSSWPCAIESKIGEVFSVAFMYTESSENT